MKSASVPILVCFLALTSGFFLVWLNNSNIPEPIEEQWKVKIIDAAMRFYKATIGTLVSLGLTQPFSPLDRYIADISLIAQITGVPWWSYTGTDLKITNLKMGGVPVRVYEPKESLEQSDRPVVIYVHGGAWTMLSVDSYEPFTSRIALDANVVVISVNYRQSPQFPFPVPRQDSMAVVRYAIQHARELRIDASRIALAGDSCGGNIVASMTLELKTAVAMQMLLVPALQPINTLTPSAVENGKYMSETINDRRMYSSYLLYGGISLEAYPFLINNNHVTKETQDRLGSSIINVKELVPSEVIRTPSLRPQNTGTRKVEDDITNPDQNEKSIDKQPWAKNVSNVFMNPMFSPLLADDEVLRQMPRSYVMTGGYDVIRDDGVMYHHRLKRLGVPGGEIFFRSMVAPHLAPFPKNSW